MTRRKPTVVKEDVTCNLIPMVDIMFLLLLFFLLGADMSQRETEDLVLPVADRIEEYPKEKEATPTTIVNIRHPGSRSLPCPVHNAGKVCRDESHWVFTIRAQDYNWERVAAQLKTEAEESMEATVDPEAKVRLSSRKVIIRADGTAPYGAVQKLIEICGLAKIYKIEVGAMKPPPA